MKRRQFIKGSAFVGASVIGGSFLVGQSGMWVRKTQRKVHRILKADRTMVGTLPILRAFAGNHLDYVSPFVLLDEFGPVDLNAGSDPLRVDAHPHAGVMPTTYFLAGNGHHKDSLNYDFQIEKGEFMVFSSGRGAIHMEETGQGLFDQGGQYHGFQIWLNMPAQYKFSDPTTHLYRGGQLGELETNQYSAKVILGELLGVRSGVETLSPAFYYHIQLKPNGKIEIPTDPGHNAFAYLIEGEVELAEQKKLKDNQIALFERGDTHIDIFSEKGADLIVLGGQPLDEPVYSYGPFVMNNEAQIRQVIQDYQTGKMGDPNQVN